MLLRAQILCSTSALAGVAAASRQQKYSEVASVLSAPGLSWALPTAGPHWSTAVMPLSVVTHVSSPMHAAQVGHHTQCVPSTAALTAQGSRTEGVTYSPQQHTPETVHCGVWALSNRNFALQISFSCVTAHRPSNPVDRAMGCNSG